MRGQKVYFLHYGVLKCSIQTCRQSHAPVNLNSSLVSLKTLLLASLRLTLNNGHGNIIFSLKKILQFAGLQSAFVADWTK